MELRERKKGLRWTYRGERDGGRREESTDALHEQGGCTALSVSPNAMRLGNCIHDDVALFTPMYINSDALQD